jgi:DNA-binding PadR family transcriptional regulator
MRHQNHEDSHHSDRRGHHGRHRHSNRRRGDLSGRLLAMIANTPAQGHDLLQALEGRGVGPETIYPTLALLEDQGLIEARVEAGKKRYHATEAGHSTLRQRTGLPDGIARAVTQFGTVLHMRLSAGQMSDETAAAIAAAIDTVSTAIATQ